MAKDKRNNSQEQKTPPGPHCSDGQDRPSARLPPGSHLVPTARAGPLGSTERSAEGLGASNTFCPSASSPRLHAFSSQASAKSPGSQPLRADGHPDTPSRWEIWGASDSQSSIRGCHSFLTALLLHTHSFFTLAKRQSGFIATSKGSGAREAGALPLTS